MNQPSSILAQRRVLDDHLRSLTPSSTLMLDLDGTALWIGRRLAHALHQLAHLEDLPALVAATTLSLLPGLHAKAWEQFVGLHDLDTQHPSRNWTQLHHRYRALAWSTVDTDLPIPGVIDFAHTAGHTGAQVVFVTGRTERYRPGTETVLTRHGLGGFPVHMVGGPNNDAVPDGKVALLRRLCAPADDVRVFDDSAANLAAVRAAFPKCRPVAVCHPGLDTDPALPAEIPRIATFAHRRPSLSLPGEAP